MFNFNKNSKKNYNLNDLFKTLDKRKRPEDVAEIILELLSANLTHSEKKILERAAKGSIKRKLFGYTSMFQDFSRPVGLERQIRKAEELFETATRLSAAECSEPKTVEKFIREISLEINKNFGESDFLKNRMNRIQRDSAGMDISKRRYNKLFRHLIRMEKKLKKFIREISKYEFTKIGKSALASKLEFSEFSSNINSACFIAYYTARCNMRSEFTNSGQKRPYDEIADMLFKRCSNDQNSNWSAIAFVYSSKDVFNHLNDKQKGELLGNWYSILCNIAELLEEIWKKSEIDKETMIVRPGNDSSTWNNTANAWNKARSNWISLLFTLDMEYILEIICPGKVLRLMAADVAVWHKKSGKSLDPDTNIWSSLPLPWEVLSGKAFCNVEIIKNLCNKYGVDPFKKGWISPKTGNYIEKYSLTPELVHGISVSSPYLAGQLRKAGWFSGKKCKLSENDTGTVNIYVDQHGFVVGADQTDE